MVGRWESRSWGNLSVTERGRRGVGGGQDGAAGVCTLRIGRKGGLSWGRRCAKERRKIENG